MATTKTPDATQLWTDSEVRIPEVTRSFQIEVIDKYDLKGKHSSVAEFLRGRRSADDPRGRGLWEDHVKVFYDHRTPVLLTSEPYWLHDDSMADLQKFAVIHDLEISISGCSPHYPGRTLMIMLWDKEFKATMDE